LLASSPIVVMLAGIVALRWPATRAAASSWLVAIVVGLTVFQAPVRSIAVASAKGLSFSLFVLLIVWSALFLYNLADRLGAVRVIATSLSGLTHDPLLRVLLLAWTFSGFLQGIAGFGAPVAAVAPILVALGVSPILAVVSAMVGHSWAITFGSMGSSYFAIQIATRLPGETIGPWMAGMFWLPIIATGACVLHVNGGWRGVLRGAPTVAIVGTAMAAGMLGLNLIGAAQISSMLPALAGCGLIWLLSRGRTRSDGSEPKSVPAVIGPRQLSFHTAFLPYYILILLTIIAQIPQVQSATAGLFFGLNYPATETALGYRAAAETGYAKIRLANHPAPLILLASGISYVCYRALGLWKSGSAAYALATTAKRSIGSGLAIVFMVMMALVVNDTGMANVLARELLAGTGQAFPMLSPYLGVLGSFITGSNTNSNVMFGPLQAQTAHALAASAVVIAAAQSIGGSIGAGVSPDKSVLGAAVTGLVGRESEITRRALPYALVTTFVIGLETLALIYLAPGLTP
jgi:lactate permease